jgi:hypothetical protein
MREELEAPSFNLPFEVSGEGKQLEILSATGNVIGRWVSQGDHVVRVTDGFRIHFGSWEEFRLDVIEVLADCLDIADQ